MDREGGRVRDGKKSQTQPLKLHVTYQGHVGKKGKRSARPLRTSEERVLRKWCDIK